MVDSDSHATRIHPMTYRARLGMAVLSALLLNVCFPVAGPVSLWRTAFGWFGGVPLLVALLGSDPVDNRRHLRESWMVGWLFGFLWYGINCYWIYQTMYIYGNIPALGSAGILVLYSILMGLYYALFGLLIGFLRKSFGGPVAPLLAVPVLWVAIDLLGEVAFRVPWDQLGYSQVSNTVLSSIAPWTGVYGVTFLLLAVNACLVAGLRGFGRKWLIGGLVAGGLLQAGTYWHPAASPTEATAVLLQENLDVQHPALWVGPEWDMMTSQYIHASEQNCTPYLNGLPETNAPLTMPDCHGARASVVIWPEAPSPFREKDPRFRAVVQKLTEATGAGAIVGNVAIDQRGMHADVYNAASVFAADGALLGRYAKIHLVPWGEYIPFQNVFQFAHRLTGNVGDFTHGWLRPVFRVQGHRYGIFICYESIFANEIRQFALNGAEVLVNISDDGWYGDTSAPWQHLNMARMRAVENRRWILRDTNTGVTAAIDPYGRVTQSIDRHQFTSLAVRYGFRDDLTFYTRYGDVFALLCGILSLAFVARGVRLLVDRRRA